MRERAVKSVQTNEATKKKQHAPDFDHNSNVYFPDAPIGDFTLFRKSSCACGGGCPGCQAKSSDLKVSQPNDPAEIEADHIADQVMHMPTPGNARWQHKTQDIQAKFDEPEAAAPELSSDLAQHINGLRGGGTPLPDTARAFFEPRFEYDFSQVRMHTGERAAEIARTVNALAFTVGRDIVFGAGQYAPQTLAGQNLMAHELTHVAQSISVADSRMAYRVPDDVSPDWKVPTDGVVHAWIYNQIDNWHTGAVQGLGNFKDAVKGETSVGFWLGLSGNVIWALGAFGSPPVAVTVGLTGIAIGTIGSAVQAHEDKEEADRVEAIFQDFLNGFNDARSKMNKEVIPLANTIMASYDFKNAVSKKSTKAWQDVVKKKASMPEGDNLNQISNNTERNLYNKYLRERGAWVSHDIFHVESPHHPGFESEEKHFYTDRVPSKVIERLNKIGVDWRRIFELPIPHRHRDLYRMKGTVGAIEYWNYEESTMYPPDWTKEDIKEFLRKAPAYMAKEGKGVTY